MGKENIRWCRWKCEKKVLKCLKKSHFLKKKVSYLLLVFCFFWPVRYREVIFPRMNQTGLEISVSS